MIRALLSSLAFAFVAPVTAASPSDVLSLVPDDYTFCFVAHQADAKLRSPADSKLSKAFWESAAVKQLAAHPDVAKLLTAKDQLVKQLGTTDADLTDLAFGGTLALAYRKPADSKPESEAGILILRTERAKNLADMVSRINQLQIRGGELSAVEEVKHKVAYWKRVKTDPTAAAEFFWIGDGLLIFTSNEKVLHETLARRQAGLANALAASHFQNLGLEDTPLALMVNPRSFDHEVEAETKTGKPGERAVLDLFVKTWKSVDQIALYAKRTPDLTLGLAITCQTERLPSPIRSFLKGFESLQSWDRIPANALFATVLPFRPAVADEFLKSIIPAADHQKIRDALVAAVSPVGEEIAWETFLKAFGPEIAVWVSHLEDKIANPSVAVAMMLDPADATAAAKLATDGLDFAVRLLCLSDGTYKVSTLKVDGVSVKKLAHPSLPKGVEPCYAVRDGALILASHPRMIGEYNPSAGEIKARAPNPLVRMSGRAWRDYLSHNAERVASVLEADPKRQATFSQFLKSLGPVLGELDRVEINVTAEKNRARLQLQFLEHPRPAK